ncbi:hypothetical protein GCM10027403_14660 [Arthrobacter tecti]
MARKIEDTEREMLRDMYAAGKRGDRDDWEESARRDLRVEPLEWPQDVRRAARAAWFAGYFGYPMPEHDHYYRPQAALWLCRECGFSADLCESGNINKLYA